MVDAGYGRIVNVTSIHSRFTEPGSLAYAISKAGLESVTRTAAIELAASGILANAVAPGFGDTRMAVVGPKRGRESSFPLLLRRAGSASGTTRAAAPEVAHAIAWLASSLNTYTTGQSLVVDGGLITRF